MEVMNFNLPKINFNDLHYQSLDNVSSQGRSNTFEDQNKIFLNAGYNKYNSNYLQTFDVDENCIKFGNTVFPRFSMSIIKQYPGQTIPNHIDTFYTFALKNGILQEQCVRINIFLEDWKNGHYFEIKGKPVLQWKKGDAVMIYKNELHLSGNMGMEPKYTMQITGVWDEFKGC